MICIKNCSLAEFWVGSKRSVVGQQVGRGWAASGPWVGCKLAMGVKAVKPDYCVKHDYYDPHKEMFTC